MGYIVGYQPDRDLIFVRHEGDLDYNVLLSYGAEALKLAAQHNCHRFLIDQTQSVIVEDTARIFEFAAELDKLGLQRTDKVAVLIARDIANHLFFETVARNRGYNLRYFYDVAPAMEWLEQTQP